MPASIPALGSQTHLTDGSADLVQDALARMREELYGGRGPGIGDAEWLANTSLRPAVGGVPTAASREQLHLRTLGARGEREVAVSEATWAAAQYAAGSWGLDRTAMPEAREHPSARGEATASAVTRRVLRGAGWLAAAVLWVRRRRRRRESGEESR